LLTAEEVVRFASMPFIVEGPTGDMDKEFIQVPVCAKIQRVKKIQ
jgi:hypothetical protein